MQFSTLASLLLAASAAVVANPLNLEARTNPKANEYKSSDCSGPINYPHSRPGLGTTNMDPSSHSVYLAGATWDAYSGPNLGGGKCSGTNLGVLHGECNNLDSAFGGERIACVQPE